MVCSFFIPKMKGVRKIATTGIWKIEKRLDNVIDYTTNIEKTIVTVKQTSGLNVRHQSNRITTKLKETLRH